MMIIPNVSLWSSTRSRDNHHLLQWLTSSKNHDILKNEIDLKYRTSVFNFHAFIQNTLFLDTSYRELQTQMPEPGPCTLKVRRGRENEYKKAIPS